ncbi:MAG: FIST C-terminal domain-containing protein [Lewinellaceae bacterium]|nr:FIST C-terminal domain-containing protein [Lewinellaceae bacterium]
MLRFYSASNGVVNSEKAMYNCLELALAERGEAVYQQELLIVIHTTIGHDFTALLSAAHQRCPQATVVGCTCAGVIGIEGANENMRALGIMVAEAEKKGEFGIAYCDNIRGYNSYQKAREMAETLKAETPGVNMVHILASGIDIAADRALEGVADVFGNEIPVFGGTSSDNMRAISTYQFVNCQILERGAIMIGYADPSLKVEMGVHHGSVPVGRPLTVTRSRANQVFELDGQPAWSLLMEKLSLPENSPPGPCIPVAGLAELLPDEYHQTYDNQHILRVIVKVDEEDKSFYLPVDCSEGTRLWLTQRDENLIFSGLERMIQLLSERIEGQETVAVFHTDCAARGRAMFNKIVKDEIIEKMQSPLMKGRRLPWLGMYGFGEFTKLNGKNLFHNYTTSIYALVRRSTHVKE